MRLIPSKSIKLNEEKKKSAHIIWELIVSIVRLDQYRGEKKIQSQQLFGYYYYYLVYNMHSFHFIKWFFHFAVVVLVAAAAAFSLHYFRVRLWSRQRKLHTKKTTHIKASNVKSIVIQDNSAFMLHFENIRSINWIQRNRRQKKNYWMFNCVMNWIDIMINIYFAWMGLSINICGLCVCALLFNFNCFWTLNQSEVYFPVLELYRSILNVSSDKNQSINYLQIKQQKLKCRLNFYRRYFDM